MARLLSGKAKINQEHKGIKMTEKDKQAIADKVVMGLKDFKAECPHGIDLQTAMNLKEFSDTWQSGKKTAIKVIIIGIISTLMGFVVAGIMTKYKSIFFK